MRVAWFRARPAAEGAELDDTPLLLDELRGTHEVVVYDERTGHDFVWQHARRPFDLPVYELNDSTAAAFVWPYVLHYPGLLRLRSASLDASRRRALHRERRLDDFRAEQAAGGATRIPVLASRLVAVADPYLADTLQDECPGARIRHAPLCAPPGVSPAAAATPASPVIGMIDTTRLSAVERAAARARDAGSRFELSLHPPRPDAVSRCDVVVVLPWPSSGEPPVAALLGMAASRCVVVYETAATAGWPALDPQTWQARGLLPGQEPIVVSIDPRDEEHSLMLAFRRLADDPALRQRLGTAAHGWWQSHATPPAAAAVWRQLLDEAAGLPPPARPAEWPPHLYADGTGRARALLAELGVEVDFLD